MEEIRCRQILLTVVLIVYFIISQSSFAQPIKGKVIEVIDSNTLKVDINGAIKTIKLLGIGTPESYMKNNKPEEFKNHNAEYIRYWQRVSDWYAYSELLGERVTLESNSGLIGAGYPGEEFCYLYLPGKRMFNKLLLQKGLAVTDRERQYKFKEGFINAESEAKNKQEGIWSGKIPGKKFNAESKRLFSMFAMFGGDSLKVKVTKIMDATTFEANVIGDIETFRLAGIVCPKPKGIQSKEFQGWRQSDLEILGQQAVEYTEEFLNSKFFVLYGIDSRLEDAENRQLVSCTSSGYGSKESEAQGMLNLLLLENGLAKVDKGAQFGKESIQKIFFKIEEKAKKEKKGLWAF